MLDGGFRRPVLDSRLDLAPGVFRGAVPCIDREVLVLRLGDRGVDREFDCRVLEGRAVLKLYRRAGTGRRVLEEVGLGSMVTSAPDPFVRSVTVAPVDSLSIAVSKVSLPSRTPSPSESLFSGSVPMASSSSSSSPSASVSGSVGSVPNSISRLSFSDSPSVSGRSTKVPRWASSPLVSPSPSRSPEASLVPSPSVSASSGLNWSFRYSKPSERPSSSVSLTNGSVPMAYSTYVPACPGRSPPSRR